MPLPEPSAPAHATTKSPASSVATTGRARIDVVYVSTRNSGPAGLPLAWDARADSRPTENVVESLYVSHATTKSPLDSMATCGHSWNSVVYVLTRIGPPWATAPASYRCAVMA